MVPDYLTEEERKQLEELKRDANAKRVDLAKKIDKATGKKREDYLVQLMAIDATLEANTHAIVYAAQRNHLSKLPTDQAIAEGVEVLEQFVEQIHADVMADISASGNNPVVIEDYIKTSILVEKDKGHYLNASWILSAFDGDDGQAYKDTLSGDNANAYYSAIIKALKDNPRVALDATEELSAPTTDVNVRRKLPDSRRYSFMNDKVIHEVFKRDPLKITAGGKDVTALFFGGENLLKIAPSGQLEMLYRIDQKTKKSATTLISLTANADALRISKRTTAFHEVVHDTVYSIIRDALTIDPTAKVPLFIPTEAIWRRMNGRELNDSKCKLPAAQRDRIDSALAYLRNVDVFMDMRQEIDAGIIKKSEVEPVFLGGKFTRRIINASPDEVHSLHRGIEIVTSGWTLHEVPVLGIYNEMKRHILTVPLDLLDTAKGGRRNDEKTIVFRNYLLAQIVLMQYGNRNTSILLSDLYEKTGTPTPEEAAERGEVSEAGIRKRRQKDNEVIEGVLAAWVKKEWIKSYEPDKDGRGSIRGYKIDPNGERRFKIEGAEDTRKRLQKKPKKSDKS